MQPRPRRGVEVVGRLVEEQHVGTPQEQAGQPDPDDLAAGELAEPPVEDRGGQPEPIELGHRALFEVPLVADGLHLGCAAGAGVEGAQRTQRGADPEDVLDPAGAVQGEVLGQVADLPGR